jgi:hypothetical protein
VPGPSIRPRASGPAETEVEDEPAEPVRSRPVESPLDEDDDGHQYPVEREVSVRRIVEQGSGRVQREDPRDPGQEHERQNGLLPGGFLLLRFDAKPREHRPRALEDGGNPEPPVAVESLLVTARLCLGSHQSSVQTALSAGSTGADRTRCLW